MGQQTLTQQSLTLYAGSAKVDITPPLGTIINGDHVMHYARYIHDPLYAKAMLFRRGENQVAILVADICAMDKTLLDEVKLKIRRVTGIPCENVLISSTHTHAAGSVVSLLLSPADLPYRQKLPGLLVNAIEGAIDNLQPAKVGFGSVDVPEHMRCRRYKMKQGYVPRDPVTGKEDRVKTNPVGLEHLIEAPTSEPDPEVGYLAVQGTNGAWIGLLANYSMHYVGDWENGTVSADYFGAFSKHLQDRLSAPEGFVGIMSNGTSGEVNIWEFLHPGRYPKEHFAKSSLIGGDIAEKVARSLEDIEWSQDPGLAVQYVELPVEVRKPSLRELEIARDIVSGADFENLVVNDQGIKEIYAREQLLLDGYPDTLSFPVQAVKIGNGAIGALGGEFFSETGLALKKQAGIPHYFTITMANGYIGYVPPAHEIDNGGYETWRCRTSCLSENAESQIRKKLLEIIRSFEKNKTDD